MSAMGVFETWDALAAVEISLRHKDRSFQLRVARASDADLAAGHHHFGFVVSRSASLQCASGEFAMGPHMYFRVPGSGRLRAAGPVFLVSQLEFHGMFMIGGPTEESGRLRYIDGCSDSLLIPPVIKGDACLNLLCIPPGVSQTAHTHPSFRVGIVIDGQGICRTAGGDHALQPGQLFLIHADGLHSFHTPRDSGLRVIAFHPDSDFGPTHEDHPMLNRTLVRGTPIAELTK